MEHLQRYRQTRKVTLIGAGLNLFLAIIKLIFGWLGHSQALFADGIHSLSDLITDGLVLFAAKVGAQKADLEHPYGHGRIETAAAVALSVLLILVGFGIFLDAGVHLLRLQPPHQPSWPVLLVAGVSILVNEFIYQYTMYFGNKLNSNLLRGNAWHSRTDALSSFIVLLGAAASLLGFRYADAIAAMLVSLFIIKMGWNIGWSSMRELVDTGVDAKTLDQIAAKINSVAGVHALHQLRTRSMAGDIFVDVHIQVDSQLSVSEGHYIGDQVRAVLLSDSLNIKDVTIHIDPEDDEQSHLSSTLPKRAQILALLAKRWQSIPEYQQIKCINLHYLGGKVAVDIIFPLELVQSRQAVEQQAALFFSKLKQDRIFSQVRLYFH